jgi:membrane-bound ClpP family serine protease
MLEEVCEGMKHLSSPAAKGKASDRSMNQRHQRQQKKTTGWSGRTLMIYSLMQLPELGLVVVGLITLQYWVTLPSWLFWGIIAVCIAKDVVLFPFVWRSYDSTQAAADALIGAVGVTRERLAPTGYIRVRGVLWRAEVAGGGPPIEPGKTVKVEERHGLTLIVVAEEKASST